MKLQDIRDNVGIRLEPGTYEEMDETGLKSLHIYVSFYDLNTNKVLSAASVPIPKALTEKV